jgi:hypothetical protein
MSQAVHVDHEQAPHGEFSVELMLSTRC